MDPSEKSHVDDALATIDRLLLEQRAGTAVRDAANELNVMATGGDVDGGLPGLDPSVNQLVGSAIVDSDRRARLHPNAFTLIGHASRFAEHHLQTIEALANTDTWDWSSWDEGLPEAGFRPDPPAASLDDTDALRVALALVCRASADVKAGCRDHTSLQRAAPLLAEQVTLSRWA